MRIFKKIQDILTALAENYRLEIWVLLLLLTATILLFPTQLKLEYHPIQSLYLFGNDLPFFTFIFYIWFILLVLMILTGKKEEGINWEKIGLVCISSLVFVGFWVIVQNYGRLDYLGFASQMETIQQTNHLSSGALYWDFPGLNLLGTSLCEITNMDIFDTMNISLLFYLPIISGLLYLLFYQLLKNPNSAAFASLLVILGNMYLALAYTYHPNIISFIPLLAFLLVLINNQYALPEIIIMSVLMATVTILYFQTSMLFPLILIGFYIVQRIRKSKPISISIILLFLIIPAAWEIYATVKTFGLLSNYVSRIAESLTEGTFLNWFFFLASSNAGSTVPKWASLTRLFWWGLIYGMGTIMGLLNLLKVKTLSSAELVITGGLIGTMILIAIATVASPGGERFTQYLQYAAFFTVPPLIYFFLKPGRIRQIGFSLLVCASIVLSLPSFLAHNSDVITETSYSYEMSAGAFLRRSYAYGEGLYAANVFGAISYYVPKATLAGGYFWAPVSGEVFMENKEAYIDDFLRRPGDYAIYLSYNRDKVTGVRAFGIRIDDPRWQQFERKLEDGYAWRIYNNSFVSIWKPPLLR